MDLDDVETISFDALGGSEQRDDQRHVRHHVTMVEVNLAAAGGTAGDGQVDTIFINATNGDE
jgi:hypothetical protein